jgi:cobyrinic acid a,c-diamide synthase
MNLVDVTLGTSPYNRIEDIYKGYDVCPECGGLYYIHSFEIDEDGNVVVKCPL